MDQDCREMDVRRCSMPAAWHASGAERHGHVSLDMACDAAGAWIKKIACEDLSKGG